MRRTDSSPMHGRMDIWAMYVTVCAHQTHSHRSLETTKYQRTVGLLYINYAHVKLNYFYRIFILTRHPAPPNDIAYYEILSSSCDIIPTTYVYAHGQIK